MIIAYEAIKHKLDKQVAQVMRQSCIDKKHLPSAKDMTYASFLSNKMLIVSVIQHGIPYSFFRLIQQYTPFSEKDWAGFLELSTKSLQRYKQASKSFKPLQSEKIIEMAEVTHMGLEVFGDLQKFRLWLDTPNYALGNMKPIELMKDSYGKEMVLGELTRVHYGIFA